MEMNEKQEILEKIENLVASAEKFNEMSFRMILEGMVNKGGEDAEYLVVRFISSQNLDLPTRINIIRVAGYLQSPHFLIPLKKIIDNEENVQLKKEAVISVAKYNNRQALNILNNALNHIKNPLLLQLLNNEIGKRKKNNPNFALLPRFLEGEKDTRNFNVTVDILKRILSANDAVMFTAYLNCGKPIIEQGAFEILCHTADISVQEPILGFFHQRFTSTPCGNQPICDDLYFLVLKIKHYFFRNPSLIDIHLDDLGTQMFFVKDPRIREVFCSIICRSHQEPAIHFVESVYNSETQLRIVIIREYSGNDAAMDFLFTQYRSNTEKELKKEIMKSLLTGSKGIDFFYNNYSSLEPEEREMVIECLPYGGYHDLSQFIKMILESENPEIKYKILHKIKDFYEFSVKDILFDPARENEFFVIEQEYIDTITHLFPVTSVKMLLEKIALSDVTIAKCKKYLKKIHEVMESGYVLTMKDKDLLTRLFRKIIFFQNTELTILFLSVMSSIKTFDLDTYKNIESALGVIASPREAKLGVQESTELRKVQRNLSDMVFEIRNIEEGFKVLMQMFSQRIPDVDHAAQLLTKHSMTLGLLIPQLQVSIERHLNDSSPEDLNQWVQLFHRFPMLAITMREAILKKSKEQKGYYFADLAKLHQTLPQTPYKIVIRLNEKSIAAALRDQFKEIIPDIPLNTETGDWQDGDMLICDSETLKDFILNNALPSKKLFLLLDKRSDFSSFKSYNPRPLVKPFSAYRIMKEVVKELYL